MDHLDQEIADAFTEQPMLQGPGRILLVGASTRLQTDLAAKLLWGLCQNVSHRLRELSNDFVDVSRKRELDQGHQ